MIAATLLGQYKNRKFFPFSAFVLCSESTSRIEKESFMIVIAALIDFVKKMMEGLLGCTNQAGLLPRLIWPFKLAWKRNMLRESLLTSNRLQGYIIWSTPHIHPLYIKKAWINIRESRGIRSLYLMHWHWQVDLTCLYRQIETSKCKSCCWMFMVYFWWCNASGKKLVVFRTFFWRIQCAPYLSQQYIQAILAIVLNPGTISIRWDIDPLNTNIRTIHYAPWNSPCSILLQTSFCILAVPDPEPDEFCRLLYRGGCSSDGALSQFTAAIARSTCKQYVNGNDTSKSYPSALTRNSSPVTKEDRMRKYVYHVKKN